MTTWVPPRLRTLIGQSLDAVSADSLEQLIGLPESVDLEFKQEIPSTADRPTDNFLYSVAALANASGGLIVFGVIERRSVAEELTPVDESRDFVTWVHQVVGDRVSPLPEVAVAPVPVENGSLFVVAVSPSLRSPHGVRNGPNWRYPIRSGASRRWLSEPEIADYYRRRFESAGLAETRVVDLATDPFGDLEPSGPESDDELSVLVVAAVPEFGGLAQLRRGLADEYEGWLNDALNDFPTLGRGRVRARVGFRAIEFTDGIPGTDEPYLCSGQLGMNGSGRIAIGQLGGRGALGVPDDGVSALFDEYLVGDVTNCVTALSNHALLSGAGGNLLVAARVRREESDMMLAQFRSVRIGHGQLNDTRRISAATGVSLHSLPVDDLASGARSRLGLARMLLGDLFSSFGLAEPQQITVEGELVRNRFNSDFVARVEAWASENEVPLIPSYEN